MKQLKGILFDFNGTLFFDSRYHIEAFLPFFPEYHLETPTKEELVSNIFGKTNAQIYRENYNANATDEEIEAFGERKELSYIAACRRDKENLHLVEGTIELLDYLKENNIPYGMATGSPKMNIAFYNSDLGLGKWFDIDKNITYDDHTFPGKPAPDIYIKAAKQIGLDASECLIFEDGTSGLRSGQGAKAGGLVAIYEEGMPSPITPDLHVDFEIHSLRNWKEILKNYGLMKG